MECDICKQHKNDIFKCDGCKRDVCAEKNCGNLTATEIRAVKLNTRALKFHCTECINTDTLTLFNKIIKDKEDLIRSKDEIINLLRKDIQILETKITNREESKSYSQVLINGKETKQVLIIDPIGDKRDTQDTVKDLKQNIDPVSLEIGVNRVKSTRNGRVIIECENKSALDKMEKTVKETLGTNYAVIKPKMKYPCVKIFNVSEEDKDDIDRKIINQNKLEEQRQSFHFRIKHCSKVIRGTFNLILETDGQTFNQIIQEGTVRIGWKRCKITEHVNVIRCFNCCKYGHVASECKERSACPKCSLPHEEKDCKEEQFKCVNCVEAKRRFNIDLDVNHPVWDRTCKCYIRIREEQLKKIRYE